MADQKPSLDAAYALQTPEDNRQLYAKWAQTYDSSFAAEMDYRMPQIIAMIFAEEGNRKSPVLDVGAGTGLLAEAIPTRGMMEIDALDISPEMLEVAQAKGIYRKTIEGDLTATLPIGDGIYGGIVSAGTFTHGHVGPDALDELMRVARQGAVFVLGINAAHYEAHGFAAKLKSLAPRMSRFRTQLVDIYGDAGDADHAGDQAQVVVFEKR